MDTPQWYNRKLWNTSSQSIDGKPVRSQSAIFNTNRAGSTSQSMTGNLANHLTFTNLILPNKSKEISYKYFLKNKPQKSTINSPLHSLSSNYFINVSSSNNFVKKSDSLTATEILTFQNRPVTFRYKYPNIQNETKPFRVQYPSKIISPHSVEYDPNIYPLTKKYDTSNANHKSEKYKIQNSETRLVMKNVSNEFEQRSSPSSSMSHPLQLNPDNPNFSENSSQISYPKKSILKKNANIIYPPQIVHNSNNRILSASLKPIRSSEPLNKSYHVRKQLQSAPGTKREVRFDMDSNNIIEYSECD